MRKSLRSGFAVFIGAVAALAAAMPALCAADPDYKQLTSGLAKTPRPHPYLMFSDADKPAMLARIKGDRRSEETYEKFLLEGRRLINATVEHLDAPPREMHTRYVGADDYRKFVQGHLDAAFTLAFLYQMTGDTKYVAKAFEHANVVCAQESWMQTPHTFDVIYTRTWPFGAKDDEVAFTYDITASAVSQQMAYIYDWLYPALPKPQRDRLRGALLEKAIMRVRGNYEYLWWATAYKCNWSGICHTGLGMAALALLDDDPQLVDVVARSCEGISAMLDHIGEDGGWQEGRGYWAYGLGESVRFIDAVKRVSGGSINLFKHRALATHPCDFGLFGATGGFGDGSGAAGVGESYVMNKLTQESGDARAAWYVKNFVRSRDEIYDLIWPAATVKAEKPAETSKFFPSIDWAVLRKDFGADYLTVATKAGMNDDPHHGHLDCGTFILTWQNQTFVGEVPRTPYDERYFGAMRWDYLEARTAGHNCVLVNGEEQICAKLKDQPWKEGIGGHITSYTSDPAWAGVAMDPTHAYPGEQLKGWNRWIALDKEQNIVVVVDKVRCAVGAEIEVRFHPGVDLEVDQDHVTLRGANAGGAEGGRGGGGRGGRGGANAGGRGNANAGGGEGGSNGGGRNAAASSVNPTRADGEHRYAETGAANAAPARAARRAELEMLPLTTAQYSLVQGRQPDLPVTETPQLSWAPYYSTVVKAPAEENVIVSVFYPTDLKTDGARLACKLDSSSGTPAMSYTVRGKTVHLTFAADKITRTVE